MGEIQQPGDVAGHVGVADVDVPDEAAADKVSEKLTQRVRLADPVICYPHHRLLKELPCLAPAPS